MNRILDRIGNGYRLYILGDLNGWIQSRMRSGIIEGFGVPGDNSNGKRMVELFIERGLCVGNIYLKHKGTKGLRQSGGKVDD